MFVYCGNNPVNKVDSMGLFWNEIVEFAKIAVAEIGKAISVLAPAYAACGGASVADGPLPIGDTLAATGAIAVTIGGIVQGLNETARIRVLAEEKGEEKAGAITASLKSRKQAYFNLNPYDFSPKGLIMREYKGSKNGGKRIKNEKCNC